MNVIVIILCSFLIVEVVAYTYFMIQIKKRLVQVMRYSEYLTLAILEYSIVLELLDQYIHLEQIKESTKLKHELILDIKKQYAVARNDLETALKYYNPDHLDLELIVKPLTSFKEKP